MKVLESSLLRVLVPVLITGLCPFNSNVSFVNRVLPSAIALMQALSQFITASPVVSAYLKPFERSYLSDEPARLTAYCATLQSAPGAPFACAHCTQKYASLFLSLPLHRRIRCTHFCVWFCDRFSDLSSIVSHTSSAHPAVAKREQELQTHWLLELTRTIASFGGRCCHTLALGIAVGEGEKSHAKWVESAVVRPGLEPKDYAAFIAKLNAKFASINGFAVDDASAATYPEEAQLTEDERTERRLEEQIALHAAVWERADELDAATRAAVFTSASYQLFVNEFLDAASVTAAADSKVEVKAAAAKSPEARAARLLSQVVVKKPRTLLVQSEKSVNDVSVKRAVAYTRIALLKHAGLLRAAMTFSQVLAAQNPTWEDGKE
jgi:hypothetical protein